MASKFSTRTAQYNDLTQDELQALFESLHQDLQDLDEDSDRLHSEEHLNKDSRARIPSESGEGGRKRRKKESERLRRERKKIEREKGRIEEEIAVIRERIVDVDLERMERIKRFAWVH